MFAPNIVTVTNINTIEGGIAMFPAIIITIVILVLAASVAALLALTLTDYDLARSIVDAIPVDVDGFEATIARIPGTIKRWAKTTKTATKEAWHTAVDMAHDIAWAIGAISWLFSIVFAGVCDDAANMIANGNNIIDAAVERVKRLRGMIRDIIGDTKNIAADIRRITKTTAFYTWRAYVGIKDTVNLALDFIYAAYNYIKAHAPSIMTDIQVNTWNAITGTANAIVNAAKTIIGIIKDIARFVREILGIFAAIGKLIGWINGGISIDTNKAMAKVANSF